jgi:hypothetical protein
MSDVNHFIDAIGKDVNTALVPKIDQLVGQISKAVFDQYGPRVSTFGEQLVKDVITEQSETVRGFVTGVVQDLAQRYRPEVAGELHTHLVPGGVQVTGQGVKLNLTRRDTGETISSLDIPVSITIRVDPLGVTLQNATVTLDLIR